MDRKSQLINEVEASMLALSAAQDRAHAAKEWLCELCPIKLGAIIQGAVSMSGKPCMMIVTDIEPWLTASMISFRLSGYKIAANGKRGIAIQCYGPRFEVQRPASIDGALDQWNNPDARRGF